MKFCWILALCFALILPLVAQSADNEPASRDQAIPYLRTMHSHDMMKRVLEVQSQSKFLSNCRKSCEREQRR
jgi:hypothetical protein